MYGGANGQKLHQQTPCTRHQDVDRIHHRKGAERWSRSINLSPRADHFKDQGRLCRVGLFLCDLMSSRTQCNGRMILSQLNFYLPTFSARPRRLQCLEGGASLSEALCSLFTITVFPHFHLRWRPSRELHSPRPTKRMNFLLTALISGGRGGSGRMYFKGKWV